MRWLGCLTGAALLIGGGGAAAPLEVTGSRRGAFLANGMGARPVGMGEAYSAIAEGAIGMAWNPAGLRGADLEATWTSLTEGVSISHVAASMPGVGGTVGGSLTVLGFGDYEQRDASGFARGRSSPTDIAMAIGYAGRLPGWLGGRGRGGMALHTVSEHAAGTQVAASLGFLADAGARLTIGAAAAYLGPAEDGFRLPATLRAGAAYRLPGFGRLAADAVYELVGGRVFLATGAEWSRWSGMAARLGYRWQTVDQGYAGLTGVTFGGGVRFGGLGIDYAYQPFGSFATTHRISAGWRFGESGVSAARPTTLSPSASFEAATARQAAGDYAGAVAELEAVLAVEPRRAEVWQALGICRYELHDLSGALAASWQSLAIAPDNPPLRAWVTQVSDRLNHPTRKQSAEDDYRAALERFAAGDHADAARLAERATKADPKSWAAWQLLGNCRSLLGDAKAANTAWQKSLKINPDNPNLKAVLEPDPPR